MERFNPECCGMRLQMAVQVLGYFEMLGYSIALLQSLYSLWTLPVVAEKLHILDDIDLAPSTAAAGDFTDVLVLSLTCAFFLLGLISAIILLIGVRMGKTTACKIWMTVKILLVILAVIHLIVSPGVMSPWGPTAYVFDALLVSFSVPAFAAVYSLVGEITKKKQETRDDTKVFKEKGNETQHVVFVL